MQHTVIESVVKGSPQADWTIFRYNKKLGLAKTLGRLAFSIACVVLSLVLFHLFKGDDKNTTTALATMIAAFGLFISFLMRLRVWRCFESNMLVFTSDRIVKSWGNKVTEYPYNDIMNQKLYYRTGGGRFPRTLITFCSKQNKKQTQLVENNDCGQIETIFATLEKKLK